MKYLDVILTALRLLLCIVAMVWLLVLWHNHYSEFDTLMKTKLSDINFGYYCAAALIISGWCAMLYKKD